MVIAREESRMKNCPRHPFMPYDCPTCEDLAADAEEESRHPTPDVDTSAADAAADRYERQIEASWP